MKNLFAKLIAILLIAVMFSGSACGGAFGQENTPEQTESLPGRTVIVNYTEPYPLIPFVRVYGPQMLIPVKGSRVTHRAFLPIVRMTDGGFGNMAEVLERIAQLPEQPDNHSDTPGHVHSWTPHYRYVNHPAEYEHQCRDEQGPGRTCWITYWQCNDTGHMWQWDECTQSAAELEAIQTEIMYWMLEQAENGGSGSNRMWADDYEMPGPVTTVCEDILVREAWTESILEYWTCPCGEVRYP